MKELSKGIQYWFDIAKVRDIVGSSYRGSTIYLKADP